MALSFSTVQKAYQIFDIIKKELLPDLKISSWPQDMGLWTEKYQNNPPLMAVHGWGKKSDDGWESIAFFMEKPSKELVDRFEELLKGIRSNTHLNGPYHKNEKLWVVGWF